ncbi:MAG: SWIM zinc finger family protein [Brasilonema angustatum HA4187-MV1]|nr:SWIM zinc finger family protein [Brasilonema angustatum HA4187-MV1]
MIALCTCSSYAKLLNSLVCRHVWAMKNHSKSQIALDR